MSQGIVEGLVSKREKMKPEEECHPEPHFIPSLEKRASGGGSGGEREVWALLAMDAHLRPPLSHPVCQAPVPPKVGEEIEAPGLGALELELSQLTGLQVLFSCQTSVFSLSRAWREWGGQSLMLERGRVSRAKTSAVRVGYVSLKHPWKAL